MNDQTQPRGEYQIQANTLWNPYFRIDINSDFSPAQVVELALALLDAAKGQVNIVSNDRYFEEDR